MPSFTNTSAIDEGSWVHGCFMVVVGSDFATYKDLANYTQQDEIFGSNSKAALDSNVSSILSSIGGNNGALPSYFSLRKCRDTSLGGNDAINPLPQFGIDDDISHPIYYAQLDGSVGMGQVYSENYDDTQQILYLGFGIPLFSNLASFWGTATDMDMANFANKGTGITAEKIGYLIGSAPVRILSLATVPYKWVAAWVNTLQQVKITKYYSFSSQMPMYFRFVNTITVILATNMNIMASSTDISTTGSSTSGTTALSLSNTSTTGASASSSGDLSGMSAVFKNYGLDMAQIMTKRYLYENGSSDPVSKRWTDDAMFTASGLNNGMGTAAAGNATTSTNATSNSTNTTGSTTTTTSGDGSQLYWQMSWIDAFTAAYSDAIYDGHLFIGFRIDKGLGASESFSNTTGESQISQVANSKFQEGYDASVSTMGGNIGNGVLGSILGGAIDAAKGILTGVANSISLDPLAAVMTGSAKIDIPEVWMNSSYSRSSSFSISCMSPYGDIESIFQSLYVPFACMLAGVLPRATGYSSHAAPFVCQAYCRGVFSSPLCLIESVEIVRGAEQFGFTAARLPTKLTMHVTLKDLYPVMAMTMGGTTGIAADLLGNDDLFNEYLLTMSGMGLRDRLSPFRNIRRKAQILLSTVYKNKLSPFMLGMEGGSQFMLSRAISTITGAAGTRVAAN